MSILPCACSIYTTLHPHQPLRPAELDVLVLEAELKLDDAAAAKDFAACKDLTSHLEALKDRRKLSPTVGELNADITACQESING